MRILALIPTLIFLAGLPVGAQKIERDKEVIIPERYKVCSDNARYPVYRQMPNEPRKIVGEVLVYPYSWIRESTEAEYLAMKVKPKAG